MAKVPPPLMLCIATRGFPVFHNERSARKDIAGRAIALPLIIFQLNPFAAPMTRGCLILLLALTTFTAFGQENFFVRLSDAAMQLTKQSVVYDPAYTRIKYPNGDVPSDRGVCTDVIIRAYRTVEIDLQKEVHEDMRDHFSEYPGMWGLTRPDKNIDHRRVPNLMVFFRRMGETKMITNKGEDYLPGDIVCWNLGGAVTHIGIVVNKVSRDGKRPLIVHNIGAGQVLADCLFDFTIIGHYRYKKP